MRELLLASDERCWQIMLSGGGGCSRLSNHLRLRDCDVRLHHQHLGSGAGSAFGFGFGFVFVFGLGRLGFYNNRVAQLRCCPCPLRPLSAHRMPFSSFVPSKSPPDIPTLSNCFRYTAPFLSHLFFLINKFLFYLIYKFIELCNSYVL